MDSKVQKFAADLGMDWFCHEMDGNMSFFGIESKARTIAEVAAEFIEGCSAEKLANEIAQEAEKVRDELYAKQSQRMREAEAQAEAEFRHLVAIANVNYPKVVEKTARTFTVDVNGEKFKVYKRKHKTHQPSWVFPQLKSPDLGFDDYVWSMDVLKEILVRAGVSKEVQNHYLYNDYCRQLLEAL